MDLRRTLREQTRDEHEAIESLIDLGRPERSLRDYGEYLRVMHAYVAALEPRLEACAALGELGIAMGERRKRGWLEADLEDLRLEPLADAVPVPAVAHLSHALGCAYVMEGATLGGRAIERMHAPRWGVDARRGGRFLAGYRERTGTMWQSFLEALAIAPAHGVDQASCVASACATFRGLRLAFVARDWR